MNRQAASKPVRATHDLPRHSPLYQTGTYGTFDSARLSDYTLTAGSILWNRIATQRAPYETLQWAVWCGLQQRAGKTEPAGEGDRIQFRAYRTVATVVTET